MSSRNMQGLARDIPVEVKLAVRQRSRFGCVVCRAALYTYEHIDPPFAAATSHDPSAICLLCPSCQALSTKGRLPKSAIAAAYGAIQRAEFPEPPRDPEFFVPYAPGVTIKLGTCTFDSFPSIIEVNGRNMLSFIPTDDQPPYVVQGEFRDEGGKPLFQIEANEWIGPVDVFDVEQVGTRLTIRRSTDHVLFQADKSSTQNIVRVSKLDMLVPPFHIHITDEILAVGRISAHGKRGTYFVLYDWQFRGGHSALALDARLNPVVAPTAVTLAGGVGAKLEGTGVLIGSGAQQMLIGGGIMVIDESGDLGASVAESFRARVEKTKGKLAAIIDN